MANAKISIVSVKSIDTVNSSETTGQEESTKLENLEKPCFPYRSIIAFIGLWGAAVMFAVRCMLSVAIVAMTSKEDSFEYSSRDNSTIIQAIPRMKTFNFTNEQQGVILGSYFYSYSALQAVGGVLADKFDVIWLNIFCHSVSALLAFLTPFAADLGVWAFVLVRVVMGAVHCTMLSTIFTLHSKWFPASELSIPICMVVAGCNVGIALAMPITAWLSEQESLGGWPMAFYVMGAMEATVPVLFFLLVSPTPSENRWTSEYEKRYIAKENSGASGEKSEVQIDWISIVKSRALWAVIIGKVGLAFGYMMINQKIPAYLEDQMKMSLKDNGMLNSLMYILLCSAQFMSGPATKYLVEKGVLPLTTTRKIFEGIALLVPAAALLAIPMMGDNKGAVIGLLLLAITSMGANTGGDMPMVSELAPDCSGTIFGITNTAASAMGFLAPMLTGYLLDSGMEKNWAWNLTFFIGSGFMAISAVYFTIFATASPKTWGLAKSRYNNALRAVMAGHRAPRLSPNTPGPVFSRHSIAY